MSRAIVAYHCGPRRAGEAVGYNPVGSPETRLGWLRDEFGPDVEVEGIRSQAQAFSSRVGAQLDLDWMLPDADFDLAVADGLRRHFPELSDEARRVIAGNFSYSHR